LVGIGAAALGRNQTPGGRLLAAIPLGFAAQQAAEGSIWLTIGGGPRPIQTLSVAVFLGFAFVAWPAWIPLALLAVETDRTRHRILSVFAYLGTAVSLGAAVLMFRWHPFAEVMGRHIRYDYRTGDSWAGHPLLLLLYVAPTIVPFYVATSRLSRVIGTTLVVSLLLTFAIERDALTSVWCFFAAILSVQILAAVSAPRPAVLSVNI
jgi:hypothetical protein